MATKPIIVSRRNGDMREVASVFIEESGVTMAEVCFDPSGRPFIPARETHSWTREEVEVAVKEMYMGTEDPRLPDNVKALPIGKREDYIQAFNDEIYWYRKESDDEYDENLPLHANAVNKAKRKADACIDPEKTKTTKESVAVDTSTGLRIKEDGVGFVMAEEFKVSEAGGYTVPVQIIKKGWSLNGNYYTQESVDDIARLASNKVCGYFNHGDHQRDPRDWNLVIESGKLVDTEAVVGTAHIFQYPDGDALKERIDYVVKNNALHLFGVSIDGFAKVEEGEMEGRTGRIVKEVVALHSVDVVMIPAAGGRWGRTKESAQAVEPEKENKKMDLETLKRDHPDLAEALVAEGRKAAEEAAEEAAAAEKAKDAEKISELEAKVAEFEAKAAADAFAAKVREYVAANITDASIRTDAFVQNLIDVGEEKWATIEALVAERKGLKIVTVRDMGATDATTSESQKEIAEDERKKIFQNALGR